MWLNGLWGTKYWHIGDYFENIACLEVTKYENRGDSDGFRQEIEQVFRNLDTDSAIILSVINKGGLPNGIHTFTAIKTDNGTIRFYSSYNNWDQPYLDYESIDRFMTEQGIPNMESIYKIERKK